MPIVKNNSEYIKYCGDIAVYPNETKTVYSFPDSTDTSMELVSVDPLWPLGTTGAPIRTAIATSADYVIPPGTTKIKVINLSASLIEMYNEVKKDGNNPRFVCPSSVELIPALDNRVRKFQLWGTAAENEVIVSFLDED